jgi:hypothetical protein
VPLTRGARTANGSISTFLPAEDPGFDLDVHLPNGSGVEPPCFIEGTRGKNTEFLRKMDVNPDSAGRQNAYRFVQLNLSIATPERKASDSKMIPLQPFIFRRNPLKIRTYSTYI